MLWWTPLTTEAAFLGHRYGQGDLLQGGHAAEQWQNQTVLALTVLLLLFSGAFVSTRSGGGWNTVYMCAYLGLGVCEYLLARHIAITHDGLPFYAPCGVVVIDAIKLFVTLVLIACSGTWNSLGQVTFSDAMQLTVPVVMYFVLNTLFYVAIFAVVLATYAITFELQIIFVAGLGWWVFGRSLSLAQALACIGVMVGAALHHSGSHTSGASWLGILLPACMAVWAASCTIVCEYVFKKGANLDINAQNLCMYSFSIVLGLIVACGIKWYNGVSWQEVVKGLHYPSVFALLLLRALFGLACSRILKYMDSLSKTIASALCAPLALGLAPFIVNEDISTLTLIAICITYVASLVYWTNPYFLQSGSSESPQCASKSPQEISKSPQEDGKLPEAKC